LSGFLVEEADRVAEFEVIELATIRFSVLSGSMTFLPSLGLSKWLGSTSTLHPMYSPYAASVGEVDFTCSARARHVPRRPGVDREQRGKANRSDHAPVGAALDNKRMRRRHSLSAQLGAAAG
jgi:hypothetical protein